MTIPSSFFWAVIWLWILMYSSLGVSCTYHHILEVHECKKTPECTREKSVHMNAYVNTQLLDVRNVSQNIRPELAHQHVRLHVKLKFQNRWYPLQQKKQKQPNDSNCVANFCISALSAWAYGKDCRVSVRLLASFFFSAILRTYPWPFGLVSTGPVPQHPFVVFSVSWVPLRLHLWAWKAPKTGLE